MRKLLLALAASLALTSLAVGGDGPLLLPAPTNLSATLAINARVARLDPPVVVEKRALTLDEFACSFNPAPGHYEVVMVHPCTGCPVKVCFDLPCRCAKKVKVSKTCLEIRYGLCKAVVVRFTPDGGVRVRD